MVENNLHELIRGGIISHKDELKTLYHIDYDHDPYSEQFVFFLSAIIFTCFAIFHKEKGIGNTIREKSVEFWVWIKGLVLNDRGKHGELLLTYTPPAAK